MNGYDDAEKFQDFSVDEIVERVTVQENVDNNGEEETEEDSKISDSDGFPALEVALRNSSQQQADGGGISQQTNRSLA